MPTLEAGIDARRAKQGADDFTQATQRMQRGADQVDAATRRSEAGISRMAASAGVARGLLTGFAGGLTAFGAVAVGQFVRSSVSGAEALKELSDKIGISVETLSVLQFQAEQSGAGMGEVAVGVKNLARVLNEAANGSDSARKVLKQLGIDSADYAAINANLEVGIAKMSAGLAKIQDPGQRVALAMKVLGRSGQDLLPFFEDLGDRFPELRRQLEATGQLITTDFAAASDTFGDAMGAMEGAGRALVGALTPLFKFLSIGFTGLGQTVAFVQTAVKTGGDFDAAVNAATDYRGALEGMDRTAGGAAKSLRTAAEATEEVGKAARSAIGPVRSLEELMQVADEFNEARKDHIVTLRDEVDALKRSKIEHEDAATIIQAEKEAYGLSAEAAKHYVRQIRDLLAERKRLTAELSGKQLLGELEAELTLLRSLPAGPLRQYSEEIARLAARFDELNNGIDSNLILRQKELAIAAQLAIQEERAEQAAQDSIQTLRDELAVMLLSNEERERAIALREFDRATAGARGSAEIQALRAQYDELLRVRQLYRELQQVAEDYARTIAEGLENAIFSADSLTDALRQVYTELARIAFRSFVTQPLTNALSGLFGGLAGGLFSAKGNVFGSGAPRQFADGGVFNGPTSFRYGGGDLGVLGEAGPEAVVPLDRDPRTGKLGLSGGRSVTQVFNIRTQDANSFRKSRHQISSDMRRAAMDN